MCTQAVKGTRTSKLTDSLGFAKSKDWLTVLLRYLSLEDWLWSLALVLSPLPLRMNTCTTLYDNFRVVGEISSSVQYDGTAKGFCIFGVIFLQTQLCWA